MRQGKPTKTCFCESEGDKTTTRVPKKAKKSSALGGSPTRAVLNGVQKRRGKTPRQEGNEKKKLRGEQKKKNGHQRTTGESPNPATRNITPWGEKTK